MLSEPRIPAESRVILMHYAALAGDQLADIVRVLSQISPVAEVRVRFRVRFGVRVRVRVRLRVRDISSARIKYEKHLNPLPQTHSRSPPDSKPPKNTDAMFQIPQPPQTQKYVFISCLTRLIFFPLQKLGLGLGLGLGFAPSAWS